MRFHGSLWCVARTLGYLAATAALLSVDPSSTTNDLVSRQGLGEDAHDGFTEKNEVSLILSLIARDPYGSNL